MIAPTSIPDLSGLCTQHPTSSSSGWLSTPSIEARPTPPVAHWITRYVTWQPLSVARYGHRTRQTSHEAAHERFTLTVFAKAIHEARLSLMITAGVDLASQPAHTAACLIEWSDQLANVGSLSVGIDDDAILRLIRTADKLGIDVPLGWPIAFADAVGRHSLDGSWPLGYSHSDSTSFRLRRTDLWLWQTLRMSQPLSVAADRIALPAMRAAALLSRLAQRPPLDGTGAVVEVYPAAALRRWDLPSRQYKRKENTDNRRDLVERFIVRTAGWLRMSTSDIFLCIQSDDAFDAVIAALVARAVSVGEVEPMPQEDRGVALREGWIAVPYAGSLSLLARSADTET
jgi:predicted nuclease with RNAse H fold